MVLRFLSPSIRPVAPRFPGSGLTSCLGPALHYVYIVLVTGTPFLLSRGFNFPVIIRESTRRW